MSRLLLPLGRRAAPSPSLSPVTAGPRWCGGAGQRPARVGAWSRQWARRQVRGGGETVRERRAVRAAPLAQGRARYPLSKETPPRSRQRRRLEQSPPTHAARGARALAPGRSGISARRPRAGSAWPASGSERCGRQSRQAIARSGAGSAGGDETRRACARRLPLASERVGTAEAAGAEEAPALEAVSAGHTAQSRGV